MSEAVSLTCPHADLCSVCSWIQHPGPEQKSRKIQALKASLEAAHLILPEIRFLSAGLGGIRDRVDLTYFEGRYGFYQKDSREIFSVEECPILSPGLYDFFKQVQKIHIPIHRGSIRLRLSPQGKKGLWLDFANTDVRDLLQERKTLQSLLDLGFVEIGQRRKKLSPELKLVDPEFHHWTRTWSQGEAIDLYSVVGSFSQSGDTANKVLIEEMTRLFQLASSNQWIEFGAGSGNLTFALAGLERSVLALEFEGLSVTGLEKTLMENPKFQDRIQVKQGDFQRKAHSFFETKFGVLVNPPRSGLQKFLNPLFEISANQRPKDFVYMSCFLESFVADGKRLSDLGYEIKDLSIVDQFPNSPHFEILSRWQLR